MTEIIIICGPSGVGKTTLINRLLSEFRQNLDFSVSFTTRGIRKGEKAGKDYNYVSKEEFHEKEFYETCEFSGNHYGTSKDEIKRIREMGKTPLLDVNVRSIKQLLQQKEIICSLIIFIKPPIPVLQTLEERLKKRSEDTGESEADIKKRLSSALLELGECEKLNLENIIINDDVDTAYKKLREMVIPLIKKLSEKNGMILENENIDAMKSVINNIDFEGVIDDKTTSRDNNDVNTVAENVHVLRVNNEKNIKIDNVTNTENGNRLTLDAIADELRTLRLSDNGNDSDTVVDNVGATLDGDVNLSNAFTPQDDNDDSDVQLDNNPNGRNCIIF